MSSVYEIHRRISEHSSERTQLDLLKTYPLLVPTNADFNKYEGYIVVKACCFRISLDVPQYPSVHQMNLSCEWELKELLSPHQDKLSQLLQISVDLMDFLGQFCLLIENAIKSSRHTCFTKGDNVACEEQVDHLKFCSSVLSELKSLGTEHLQYLSSDFKTVHLKATDLDGEMHHITLKLLPQYIESSSGRNCFDIVDTDLPEPVMKEIRKEQSIIDVYNIFCDFLESLHPLWTALALIDKNCWVIDPKHPKKADTYRRISLSNRVMAQVSWNALQPHQQPEIKFQGADADVHNFRIAYEERLEEWSSELDVLENLCSVLSLKTLPPPPDSKKLASQAVDTGECCICYDVHLNGKLPEESCGKCLNNFHAACLYEWLEMMPGSRQVHGHISGPCPNCENVIKCPCPHTVI